MAPLPETSELKRRYLFLILAVSCFGNSMKALSQQAGPRGEPKGKYREQVHLVPIGDLLIHTMVYRPTRDAPAPLAIINHGVPPPKNPPYATEAVQWFTDRGYVVATPRRRGWSPNVEFTPRPDNFGPCKDPEFYRTGYRTAQDIEAAHAYLRTLPFVAADKHVIVGQSAGGWGTIAASTRGLPGVAVAINFAGGRGGHWGPKECARPRLYEAAKQYGKISSLPMLWIYTENDSYFTPEQSRRLHESFTATGGNARFVMFPPFGADGHGLFSGKGGSKIWGPLVEALLKEHNLPVRSVVAAKKSNTVPAPP